MNRMRFNPVFVGIIVMFAAVAGAADVNVRLSSEQSYVGVPMTLRLDIVDARDLVIPKAPHIDGVDVKSMGAPSRSSQLTIINGRQSESQSISLQYQLTPTREGTFEVPSMQVKIDGNYVTTRPLSFVATKSETGNLLFVEVSGKQDRVYVGEPLELTLKIWIKPYRSDEYEIELSEANMWQLISENTSWGSFSDRMRELASQRQRPGGDHVLRRDADGNRSNYYLYEISTKIYPTRAGRIDANDVRIVVDYPTKLGNRRSSLFPSFFDDEFFGGSPFGSSLSITATRPIVATAEVDTTEVISVPMDGRPGDYRGTVGNYEIYTQIDTVDVKAGDPIQLDIGITGSGPMELVQAPPLAEIESLTRDFKVSDQPLAGFARGNTKLFTTTIRPLRAGINEIPPIPLSFFDPEAENFKTVMSEPISITVGKADSLSLDSIVAATTATEERPTNLISKAPLSPIFVNNESIEVLVNETPPKLNHWWIYLVVVPPVLWCITAVVVNAKRLVNWLPGIRSSRHRCLRSIDNATSSDELVQALVTYSGGDASDPETAIGSLRLEGLYHQAAELESFFDRLRKESGREISTVPMSELRCIASEWVQRVATIRSTRQRSLVRPAKRASGKQVPGKSANEWSVSSRTFLLLFATVVACGSSNGIASDTSIELSAQQQRALLDEANQLYSAANDVENPESAEAKELFASAARKYQQLVDSGIRNSGLFSNLGNASLRSGDLGRAIASYERAKRLNPTDAQLTTQLQFARKLAHPQQRSESASIAEIVHTLRDYGKLAYKPLLVILGLSSLLFWGLAIARTLRSSIPFRRWAAIPLCLFVLSTVALTWLSLESDVGNRGVVIAERLTLRNGDGNSFERTATLDQTLGQQVEVLTRRGDWLRVRTPTNSVGWTPRESVEVIDPME